MSESKKVVTRIYVNGEGDLLVTDLWDEVKEMLGSSFSEDQPERAEKETLSETH